MASSVATAERSTAGSPAKAQRKRSPFDRSRRRMFVPFVYPALIVYLLVMIVPTLFTFYISLNEWSGAGPMTWVGLHNYKLMFTNSTFIHAFYNTLWIVLGVGIAVFLIAFLLTILLQDMIGRKWIRLIVFFPSLIPGIVVSILWGYIFNPDGLVNTVLDKVGVHTHPAWLSSDHIFQTLLVGMVWLSVGTYTVIFMAGVDRIPAELYEAAEIEGATPAQRFVNVTMPMMWDLISVCAVLWCVGALKTFEFLLVFSPAAGQLPPKNIWNFSMYSYAEAFNPEGTARFGIAAATGVVILFATGLLAGLARRVTNKETITY